MKLNPGHAAEEPGDVCRRSGRRADDGVPDSRHRHRRAGIGFELQIALWLWFTVLFANFAEAMAEARGKAQAEALRKTKTDTVAKRLVDERTDREGAGVQLRAGDVVVVRRRRHSFPATAR